MALSKVDTDDVRHRHLSARLVVAVLVVGVCTGVCAFVLKWSIGSLTVLLTGSEPTLGASWRLLCLPLAGILLTGVYQRYVLRHNIEHGVERLSQYLAAGRYRLPGYLAYSPLLAGTLTLGFGGSAGSEGPIATVGAGIGSRLGERFGLSGGDLRLVVVMGAGAGIAAIFKAPLGGMLFVIESLGVSMSGGAMLLLLGCCLVASFTAFLLSGCTADMWFGQFAGAPHGHYLLVVALGVFCGVYSLWYSYSGLATRRMLERVDNPWVRNVVSGVLVSVAVFVFPALYGEGYGVMLEIVNGDDAGLLAHTVFGVGHYGVSQLVWIAAGVLLVKGCVAYASNCGGGVAGEFAPTLFAGCMVGYLFAMVAVNWLGVDARVCDVAFVAVAGVMAGVIRAPFMAMFITVEMAGAYDYLLPVAVVSFTSYGVVRVADLLRK